MDDGSTGTPTRHTAGTNNVRPDHRALAHLEYGLLALTGTAVNPVDAGDLGSEAVNGAIEEKTGQEIRETEEGDKTRQRALPAHDMQGYRYKRRGPHERLHALNMCGCQEGERGGGPNTQKCAPTPCSEGLEGDPHTYQCGPPL